MKQLKNIALALVAIAALSAITTATASAAGKGEFVNKAGTTVKGTIKVKSATEQVLETLAGVKVTCVSAEGEAQAETTMTVVEKATTFKGCKKSTGGTCHTEGAAAEEIKIGTLDFLAVTLDENGKEGEDSVLVTLLNEVQFSCAEVKVTVKNGGRFIASANPQKTLTTKFKLIAKCISTGMQEKLTYFEFGKLVTIPESEGLLTKIGAAGSFEGSCQKGEAEATTAEEAELV